MHQNDLIIPFGLVGGIRLGCCITSFNHPGSKEVSLSDFQFWCVVYLWKGLDFLVLFLGCCVFSRLPVSCLYSFPSIVMACPACLVSPGPSLWLKCVGSPLNIYEKQMPTKCRIKVSSFQVGFLVMWPVKYGYLLLTLLGRCQRSNCGRVIFSLVLNLQNTKDIVVPNMSYREIHSWITIKILLWYTSHSSI